MLVQHAFAPNITRPIATLSTSLAAFHPFYALLQDHTLLVVQPQGTVVTPDLSVVLSVNHGLVQLL